MSNGRATPQPPGSWPSESEMPVADASRPSSTQNQRLEQNNGKPAIPEPDNSAGARTQKRRPAPKLIAIFGRTGTGKTSFIEAVSGQAQGVGHHLTSCTENVDEILCDIDGQDVILVDTPGFNDTNLSDIDVLTRIASWMTQTYEERSLLSGIIYLHRITDNRMEGPETLNLRMFKSLCGSNNLKNVILGTTMWELAPETDAVRRENDLKNNFWKDMLARGSTLERIYRNPESAKNLVRKLLHNQPIVTRLQEQMSTGRPLRETDAGAEMTRELTQMEERLMQKFEAVDLATKRALHAGDLETQKDLKAEIAVLTRQIAGVQGQQLTLRHWEPPRKLPIARRRWNQSRWRCLAECGRKTGRMGTWTCPNRGCNMRQRNVW